MTHSMGNTKQKKRQKYLSQTLLCEKAKQIVCGKNLPTVLFSSWSEQRLSNIKNWYFNGVIQQLFGFHVQKRNELGIIIKISRTKGWLKWNKKRNEFEKEIELNSYLFSDLENRSYLVISLWKNLVTYLQWVKRKLFKIVVGCEDYNFWPVT